MSVGTSSLQVLIFASSSVSNLRLASHHWGFSGEMQAVTLSLQETFFFFLPVNSKFHKYNIAEIY